MEAQHILLTQPAAAIGLLETPSNRSGSASLADDLCWEDVLVTRRPEAR
eukprot:CAMPEP_0185174400 /NCGR_PEP_ID=MMETSP1139-20130426/25175_1 /TAXON_ID=298111 /ORGANISM="Pavlova sp., Strain CCMP459" /LENGTH=48 /DNA_ID= /DNA_START= /DNA_END= /DNA_ORIENTATION=